MKKLNEWVNFDIVSKLAEFSGPENPRSAIISALDHKKQYLKKAESYEKESTNLKNALREYSLDELQSVLALYSYGRSFIDGSITPTCCFLDFIEECKIYSTDDVYEKLQNVGYRKLAECFSLAVQNHENQESNFQRERNDFDKRIVSYTKSGANTFYNLVKGKREGSTSEVFQNACRVLENDSTKDIRIAKAVIEEIISSTQGLVVVDFLGPQNFDHLDFVEADGEVLKLYWKYSRSRDEYPNPPHNTRVDIAFEELQKIDNGKNTVIVLKGFYRNKKEVRNFYNNNEKAKKIYNFNEMNHSQFFYRANFDKKQRGSAENFDVVFLPWRYFVVVILPKVNLPTTKQTTDLLIVKNLSDIKSRGDVAYSEFIANFQDEEDYISMYGNRFRKLIESYLKFVLLAREAMFKENYEKDMLGNLLSQLKDYAGTYKFYMPLEKTSFIKLIKIVEESLLFKLNLCSHDNVKSPISKEVIHEIYSDFCTVGDLVFNCFSMETA